jgi:hypothetical protein
VTVTVLKAGAAGLDAAGQDMKDMPGMKMGN